jgi:hypothetical protein
MAEKKAYEAPALEVHGSVQSMTGGGNPFGGKPPTRGHNSRD